VRGRRPQQKLISPPQKTTPWPIRNISEPAHCATNFCRLATRSASQNPAATIAPSQNTGFFFDCPTSKLNQKALHTATCASNFPLRATPPGRRRSTSPQKKEHGRTVYMRLTQRHNPTKPCPPKQGQRKPIPLPISPNGALFVTLANFGEICPALTEKSAAQRLPPQSVFHRVQSCGSFPTPFSSVPSRSSRSFVAILPRILVPHLSTAKPPPSRRQAEAHPKRSEKNRSQAEADAKQIRPQTKARRLLRLLFRALS
jgi:hypothetical protein